MAKKEFGSYAMFFRVSMVFIAIFIISVLLSERTIYIEDVIGFLLILAIMFYIITFPHFEDENLKLRFFIGAFSIAFVALTTLFLIGKVSHRGLFPASISPLTYYLIAIGSNFVFKKWFNGLPIYYGKNDSESDKEKKEEGFGLFLILPTMLIVFLLHSLFFEIK